ncbi:MAG: hypothetical protein J4400_01875 [Candidatus Aenigmarchaeota archaeon]|nr:hypothetical protein [Candidatus Aenigmarchaeota archaeon]
MFDYHGRRKESGYRQVRRRSPMPKNPYLREGIIPSFGRYDFDIIRPRGSYFAEPGARYRLAYRR